MKRLLILACVILLTGNAYGMDINKTPREESFDDGWKEGSTHQDNCTIEQAFNRFTMFLPRIHNKRFPVIYMIQANQAYHFYGESMANVFKFPHLTDKHNTTIRNILFKTAQTVEQCNDSQLNPFLSSQLKTLEIAVRNTKKSKEIEAILEMSQNPFRLTV